MERYGLCMRGPTWFRELFAKEGWRSPATTGKRRDADATQHPMREPLPRMGMMAQVDATPYDWLGTGESWYRASRSGRCDDVRPRRMVHGDRMHARICEDDDRDREQARHPKIDVFEQGLRLQDSEGRIPDPVRLHDARSGHPHDLRGIAPGQGEGGEIQFDSPDAPAHRRREVRDRQLRQAQPLVQRLLCAISQCQVLVSSARPRERLHPAARRDRPEPHLPYKGDEGCPMDARSRTEASGT